MCRFISSRRYTPFYDVRCEFADLADPPACLALTFMRARFYCSFKGFGFNKQIQVAYAVGNMVGSPSLLHHRWSLLVLPANVSGKAGARDGIADCDSMCDLALVLP